MNERTLQAAAAALERSWLDSATDKELDLLLLSGYQPDLFEQRKEDDGGLRILFAYDPGGNAKAVGEGLWAVEAVPEKGEAETIDLAVAEMVFRRTRLRV